MPIPEPLQLRVLRRLAVENEEAPPTVSEVADDLRAIVASTRLASVRSAVNRLIELDQARWVGVAAFSGTGRTIGITDAGRERIQSEA